MSTAKIVLLIFSAPMVWLRSEGSDEEEALGSEV